jgi:hypothetical protein
MTEKFKENLFDWGFYMLLIGILLMPFFSSLGFLKFLSATLTLSFFASMGNRIIRDVNDLKINQPLKLKGKRYFTKPNELGTVYEEDENGKIIKFEDGQHY